ncbi:hypothetical protein K474DRAFT_1659343, partial [Panus rudis PR-1116 ss-1]
MFRILCKGCGRQLIRISRKQSGFDTRRTYVVDFPSSFGGFTAESGWPEFNLAQLRRSITYLSLPSFIGNQASSGAPHTLKNPIDIGGIPRTMNSEMSYSKHVLMSTNVILGTAVLCHDAMVDCFFPASGTVCDITPFVLDFDLEVIVTLSLHCPLSAVTILPY